MVEQTYYTYNSNDLLVQKLELKNGVDSCVTTYKYDSKNRIKEEHMMDLSYQLMNYKSDFRTKYILNQRIIKSIHYSGWTTISRWKNKETYNTKDILRKTVEKLGSSKIVTKYRYSEDMLQQKKEIHPFKIRIIKGIFENGYSIIDVRKTRKTTYQYNENNLLETEITEAFFHYNPTIKKYEYKYW